MREKSLASRRKEAVSLMHVGEPVRRYARSGFAANQTCAFFAPAIQSPDVHFVSSLVAVGSSEHAAAKISRKSASLSSFRCR